MLPTQNHLPGYVRVRSQLTQTYRAIPRLALLLFVVMFISTVFAAGQLGSAQAAGPARRHTPTGTPAPPSHRTYTPTPRSGCTERPPHGTLTARITDHADSTEALFTNHSPTCSYDIGLAVYKKFDDNIEHQQLYDYTLAVIPPNS